MNNSKGDQVRRIKPANAPSPESAKLDLGRFACGLRLGPLQVDAESGNDEEKKDADVTKGTDELQELYGPVEKVGREPHLPLATA